MPSPGPPSPRRRGDDVRDLGAGEQSGKCARIDCAKASCWLVGVEVAGVDARETATRPDLDDGLRAVGAAVGCGAPGGTLGQGVSAADSSAPVDAPVHRHGRDALTAALQ